MIFNNRLRVCLFFLLVSLFLAWQLATGLRMDASFQKMVPLQHPFIQNMLCHMEDGGNSGNTIRIAVVALGVGIGVDYGIYIYSRLESFMRQGMSLEEACYATLTITGKAVTFTGLTLAIGVGTWIFSPLKFQADMVILLTFMFVWNMIGAIWLMPALARLLLGGKADGRNMRRTATVSV